jgi:hypothetical protein
MRCTNSGVTTSIVILFKSDLYNDPHITAFFMFIPFFNNALSLFKSDKLNIG